LNAASSLALARQERKLRNAAEEAVARAREQQEEAENGLVLARREVEELRREKTRLEVGPLLPALGGVPCSYCSEATSVAATPYTVIHILMSLGSHQTSLTYRVEAGGGSSTAREYRRVLLSWHRNDWVLMYHSCQSNGSRL
jgi:hypothetical protein